MECVQISNKKELPNFFHAIFCEMKAFNFLSSTYRNKESSYVLKLFYNECFFFILILFILFILFILGIRISALFGISMMAAGTGIRCLQVLYLDHSNAGTIFEM